MQIENKYELMNFNSINENSWLLKTFIFIKKWKNNN